MVRHWFSLIAVLAVAVLVVATDASQAQRLLGRRFRRNVDGYVVYGTWSGPYYYDSEGFLVPGYAQEGTFAGTQTDGRRANYPPDSQAMRAPVRLLVRVPAAAEIWVEGAKTLQTGAVRRFISPPIESGREYAYKIEAKWMENGAERTRTRTVPVLPGQLVRVDLTQAPEEKE